MKKILLYILVIAGFTASSQDLSQGYYSYRMSLYNLNPGFAGDDSSLIANLVTRSYLSGYDGNPRNNLLGVHGSLTDKIGIGAKLMSDTKGEFEVSRYDVLGSYMVRFNKTTTLRFGLSAGIVRRTLNTSSSTSSEVLNQNDPVLAAGYFDETNFIAGVGVVLNSGNMKLGFSAPNIAEAADESDLNPSSAGFFVGSFSYRHDLNFKGVFVTPSVIYQNMPSLENQIDLFVKLDLKQKLWVMIGYQSTNMMTFGGGVRLGPVDVGYIHGLPTGQLSDISSNLNEVMLQIRFDNIKSKKKD